MRVWPAQAGPHRIEGEMGRATRPPFIRLALPIIWGADSYVDASVDTEGAWIAASLDEPAVELV